MTRDVARELFEAAQELVDAVDRAVVMTAFSNDGRGPFEALADGMPAFARGPLVGPIRRATLRLRQAMLDFERLAR